MFEPNNEKIKNLPDYNPGHNYKDRPNLVAIKTGTGNGKSIILNGHVDTVPLDDLSKWTNHPLSGTIKDGLLYGRGASDMKAGVAAMILAVKYINDLQIEHKGDIIIQSVVDEEGGGNGTLSCITEGYLADAAIVTEPTELQILCASRGVYLLEVEVEGSPIHSCLKWSGVNAIEKMIKIIQGLSELERQWLAIRKNPLLPSPTITLGEIQGGISAATVPGKCTARFDVKYLPEQVDEYGNVTKINGEDIKREVEEKIKYICQGDEWLADHPVKMNWYISVNPYSISVNEPIVKTISNNYQALTGSYHISGMPSGADARHLYNVRKIPTVIFGPGKLKNAHSINEHVDINEFLLSIKVLAATILD